ncbi:MAG: isoprenyl transferase [Desulfuromonadales bacterium]|uniref:isoprenyl transferase n=1 Tax=Desulfuromonas sp. KJ2020 TaxID=2919173 RepID=UPI0020A82E1F|nr:isoprenyl transferase [Desulfuromonas sp. KJ2020]MCP3177796.1 isoprenyl transferase [Desulfuromonas sp. KJ2020]
MQTPQHLAIIMDGNGRWAERRQLPRTAGHSRGADNVRTVIEECRLQGIRYLTLYAFSSENWGRPPAEIDALMSLLARYLANELPKMLGEGIRFNVIGEIERLPADVQVSLKEAMERTGNNQEMVLTLALSYGGRDEILRAVRGLCRQVSAGTLATEDIDEEVFSGALDTHDLPDPDLLIRTSGEMRVSNFLLWQLAYAELYFTETLWPDFDVAELRRALELYAQRERRYGLTAEQVTQSSSPKEGNH